MQTNPHGVKVKVDGADYFVQRVMRVATTNFGLRVEEIISRPADVFVLSCSFRSKQSI
jgi:hypothetical protein